MTRLTDKKSIADFKKKHLDAARERWLKSQYEKARRLPKPQLESLMQAVKGKKKPESTEKELCEAVDKIHEFAEQIEEAGKMVAELRAPTYPVIQKIEKHSMGGPGDVLNLLAAGILLWLLSRKALDKLEKTKN